MDIDDLCARFAACRLAPDEWTHQAHLAVGLAYVARLGDAAALAALRTRIRQINERLGGVNSESRGYHETITAAYVELFAQFLRTRPAGEPLPVTVAHLLAGPLAARDALLAFYSREHLQSAAARLSWVAPDRAPLDAGRLLASGAGGQTGAP